MAAWEMAPQRLGVRPCVCGCRIVRYELQPRRQAPALCCATGKSGAGVSPVQFFFSRRFESSAAAHTLAACRVPSSPAVGTFVLSPFVSGRCAARVTAAVLVSGAWPLPTQQQPRTLCNLHGACTAVILCGETAPLHARATPLNLIRNPAQVLGLEPRWAVGRWALSESRFRAAARELRNAQ
jgi:hypothetical protein